MPQTLHLHEESDQTAELQDLLSRLQTPEVDEFGGILNDFWALIEKFKTSRKQILDTSNLLVKEQDNSKAKLPTETKETLIEFIDLLQEEFDKKRKEFYITKLAAKWKTLKPELESYHKSTRFALGDCAVSKAHIERILAQMVVFSGFWKKQFK